MIIQTRYVGGGSKIEDFYIQGTTPPENTKLFWIDTTPDTGGLKYYNGTDWVAVPISYSIYASGTTAPTDTKLLWLDTTADTGGLKYYDGTSWVAVPVLYT